MRIRNAVVGLVTSGVALAGIIAMSTPTRAADDMVVGGSYPTLSECEAAGRFGVESQHFRQFECVPDPSSGVVVLWYEM
jgi:hypothetical protein